MRAPTRLVTAAAIALGLTVSLAVPADAAPAVTTYANCTAINRAYSGGIAKAGGKFNVVRSGGKTTQRALRAR